MSVVTNIFTDVTQAEVAGIRRACRIARSVLDGLKSRIEPGVTTDQLGKVLKRGRKFTLYLCRYIRSGADGVTGSAADDPSVSH